MENKPANVMQIETFICLLYASGYLTFDDTKSDPEMSFHVRIPNKEIMSVFKALRDEALAKVGAPNEVPVNLENLYY